MTPSNNPTEDVAYENTDKELWRKGDGDGDGMSYYEPSIHVTKDGLIGINVGGTVYQKPVEKWHELAGGAIHLPIPVASNNLKELSRKCKYCLLEFTLDKLVKNPTSKYGHMDICKKCYAKHMATIYDKSYKQKEAYQKKYRQTAKGKQASLTSTRNQIQRFPEKTKARSKLRYALLTGKILKPIACERCGDMVKLQGHHSDYSQPLAVSWLCVPCHKDIHGIRNVSRKVVGGLS